MKKTIGEFTQPLPAGSVLWSVGEHLEQSTKLVGGKQKRAK